MKAQLKKNRRSRPGRCFQDYLTITPKNKTMIDDFLASTYGEVHRSRYANYERYLWVFADRIECDFDRLNDHVDSKLTTESKLLMKHASRAINESDYSDETIRCFVAVVKLAFKHWYGEGLFHPPVLKCLKRPKSKPGAIRRRIFSEEEVLEMIDSTDDPMWKFFLAYLGFDSGARPCELRRLTWSQLEKDQYGYYFRIATAKDAGDTAFRPVRALKSAPYFLRWQRETQRKNTTVRKTNALEDFVFVNQYGQKLTDSAVTVFFSRLRKRMKLDELTALSLRRSWITRKQCDPRITTAQIQAIVGHSVGGNAIKAYTFLQDRDILNAQLHVAGHAPPETLEREIQVTACEACSNPNAPNQEFCEHCGVVLIDPAFVTVTERRTDDTERLQRLVYDQCRRLSEALEKKDLPTLRAFATAYSSIGDKGVVSGNQDPAPTPRPQTSAIAHGPTLPSVSQTAPPPVGPDPLSSTLR